MVMTAQLAQYLALPGAFSPAGFTSGSFFVFGLLSFAKVTFPFVLLFFVGFFLAIFVSFFFGALVSL